MKTYNGIKIIALIIAKLPKLTLPNLSKANLKGATLTEANLKGATLIEGDFKRLNYYK